MDNNGHIGMKNEPVDVNGKMLLDYCEEMNLKELGSRTSDDLARKWEWKLIDYILVNEVAEKDKFLVK
ncbi:hypothetical protein E2C01_045670 [Portunus trituberculatus]|uniref:Uncharacterized protein n=1 Tax=Portunus trituberculatus TaxID=210409 RepID=A0A5B7G204_PORTR|nr:hypothetical protein [Portunus trituberculatus]